MTIVITSIFAACETRDGKHYHAPECQRGDKRCPIPIGMPLSFGVLEDWMMELFPQADLPGFVWIKDPDFPYLYEGKAGAATGGVRVICSARVEGDGKRWIHVSYSRRNRIPSYEDGCFVKSAFIGEDRLAVAVYPRESEHVNIHPRCLHLWSCLDGDPVPDFRHEGQI